MPKTTRNTASRKSGAAGQKPKKPHPNFPLTPHATGRWCKKIKGRIYYFGTWSDPDGALDEWLAVKDDLLAGRQPDYNRDGLTVRDLCNHFLTDRKHRLETGDIVYRTFEAYHQSCERIIAAFGATRMVSGITPRDFMQLRTKIAKQWGPVGLGNEVNRIRIIFNFAYKAGLTEKPVQFGPTFKRPSRKVLRRARAEKGQRMLEAGQILRLLEAASVQLRAMILLGVNCGFGNADCATLQRAAVDLGSGWVDHPRPKTGIDRRCPLWAETVEALTEVAEHPQTAKAQEHDRLVFITSAGNPWGSEKADSPITKEFRKLLDKFDMHRPGIGFYTLRHVFETIAGESKDQVAVDFLMGHASDDMSSVYRERISNERLAAVVEHVHTWLFA